MSNDIVLGIQWGDEGKGKIVDLLARDADMVIRFSGGANAGHTIYIENKPVVTHLVPTGIRYPKCLNVIGNGCVVDPLVLWDEVQKFDLTPERLAVSETAHMVTIEHQRLDAIEGGKIGTTKRGIGPCYRDKINRTGYRLRDMLEAEWSQDFKSKTQFLGDNINKWVDDIIMVAKKLKPFIQDIKPIVYDYTHDSQRNVLFEGAQGTFLDIDHGSYPFVTSSNTTIGAAYTGTGVFCELNKRIGVIKAYVTRVGEGPFPTELKNDIGEKLREVGHEYGATTGRPRRCGWLDLDMVLEAIKINGINSLMITKVDCLTGFDPIVVKIEGSYREFPGWGAVKVNNNLHKNLHAFITLIETHTKVPINAVSIGPGLEDVFQFER